MIFELLYCYTQVTSKSKQDLQAAENNFQLQQQNVLSQGVGNQVGNGGSGGGSGGGQGLKSEQHSPISGNQRNSETNGKVRDCSIKLLELIKWD